jgi:hypothetical protein
VRRIHVLTCRLRVPILLFLVSSASVNASDVFAASRACPDVSGQYSVAGFSTALSDALQILHATQAGFLDSGVELQGVANGELMVRLKSGHTGAWSSQPVAVLRETRDFDCINGALVFKTPVASTHRKTDEGKWYEGSATISLSALGKDQLAINVSFSGSERITLYSYESANVSIPRPGTRTTLRDTIHWPAFAESDSLAPAKPAEATAVIDVRKLLSVAVLGNVRIGGLKLDGDAVVATLKASRSDDVVRLEDRLRAASIGYETRVEPIWSNNGYHMEFLIWSDRDAARSSRPSALRIEHELQRSLPPLVDVAAVKRDGEDYIVTLDINGSASIEEAITRLKANSQFFAGMDLMDGSVRPDAPQIRVARLKLRLR